MSTSQVVCYAQFMQLVNKDGINVCGMGGSSWGTKGTTFVEV